MKGTRRRSPKIRLDLGRIEKRMCCKADIPVFVVQKSPSFGGKMMVQFLSAKYLAIVKREPGMIMPPVSKSKMDSLTRGFYPLCLLLQNILLMIPKMNRITSFPPYRLQTPANRIAFPLWG